MTSVSRSSLHGPEGKVPRSREVLFPWFSSEIQHLKIQSTAVELTWAGRCARSKLLLGYSGDCICVLTVFKIVQGYRLLHKLTPLHDFLLVTNEHVYSHKSSSKTYKNKITIKKYIYKWNEHAYSNLHNPQSTLKNNSKWNQQLDIVGGMKTVGNMSSPE